MLPNGKHGQGTHGPKWVLIVWPKILQIPQNLSAQFVCSSPKVLDFNEKRLHWVFVVHVLKHAVFKHSAEKLENGKFHTKPFILLEYFLCEIFLNFVAFSQYLNLNSNTIVSFLLLFVILLSPQDALIKTKVIGDTKRENVEIL